MFKKTLLLVLFGAVVAACRARVPVTPSQDAVATEVSRQLTALPSATPVPTEIPPTPLPPTDTPPPADTPTPTATASPTPTGTATVVASDPKLTLGAPTWQDTFRDGRAWGIYEDTHTRVSVSNDSLVLTARNPENWSGWTLTWPTVKDIYLEAIARPQTCAGLDRYGLVLRAKGSDQGYLFGFTCDGRFSLRMWDGERFSTLRDWSASEHILTGSDQTNRVGIMARGDRFTMYANGNLLAEFQDDSYADGTFGLFVASANTPDFTVTVDEIAYWDLEP